MSGTRNLSKAIYETWHFVVCEERDEHTHRFIIFHKGWLRHGWSECLLGAIRACKDLEADYAEAETSGEDARG